MFHIWVSNTTTHFDHLRSCSNRRIATTQDVYLMQILDIISEAEVAADVPEARLHDSDERAAPQEPRPHQPQHALHPRPAQDRAQLLRAPRRRADHRGERAAGPAPGLVAALPAARRARLRHAEPALQAPPALQRRILRLHHQGGCRHDGQKLILSFTHIQGGPGCTPWLGWLRFGEFPLQLGHCCGFLLPKRMVEHSKSKSSRPRCATTWITLYYWRMDCKAIKFQGARASTGSHANFHKIGGVRSISVI